MKKGDLFSAEFVVSEDTYQGFIQLFRDKNPLHTDKAFAQSKGFKEEVMHGNILNGFLSYFIGECLPVKNVVIQTQEIKYYHPVYLNDHLNFFAEITDKFESVNMLELRYRFENRENIKVARGKLQIGILS